MSNTKKQAENFKQVIEAVKEDTMTPKVGNFVVLNTQQVKGLRLNLATILSYALNGDTAIQVAQGDGVNTMLKFASKEDTYAALEIIDRKCI